MKSLKVNLLKCRKDIMMLRYILQIIETWQLWARLSATLTKLAMPQRISLFNQLSSFIIRAQLWGQKTGSNSNSINQYQLCPDPNTEKAKFPRWVIASTVCDLPSQMPTVTAGICDLLSVTKLLNASPASALNPSTSRLGLAFALLLSGGGGVWRLACVTFFPVPAWPSQAG